MYDVTVHDGAINRYLAIGAPTPRCSTTACTDTSSSIRCVSPSSTRPSSSACDTSSNWAVPTTSFPGRPTTASSTASGTYSMGRVDLSYPKILPQDRSVVAQNLALRPSQDKFSVVAVLYRCIFFHMFFIRL